jgi:hypothetical protein
MLSYSPVTVAKVGFHEGADGCRFQKMRHGGWVSASSFAWPGSIEMQSHVEAQLPLLVIVLREVTRGPTATPARPQ